MNVTQIWCEDLVRIYSTDGIEVQVLQGLNLSIDEGDVVALVGASGSGKSTPLGILSGNDRPTDGWARVTRVELTTVNRAQRVDYWRYVAGFARQRTPSSLLPYLSAAENVALPMVTAGRRERDKRVRELLGLLGVSGCADRRPVQLSGGQQQWVTIVAALANDPRVLLADEPTGELDQENSTQVLEVIRQAAENLSTMVLIVTHDRGVGSHVRRTVAVHDGCTSTEVICRRITGPDGRESTLTEEYTVIDRAGRIQIPQGHVIRLRLKDRMRILGEEDHIIVRRGEDR